MRGAVFIHLPVEATASAESPRSVGGEALELRQEASCLAERIIPLLCEKGQSRALEKIVNGGTGKGMGKPAGGKYCIRSQAVVSRTEWCMRAEQNLTGIL